VPVKRKTGRPLLEIDDRVSVLHFNVDAGYVTYIEQPEGAEKPRLRSVLLSGIPR